MRDFFPILNECIYLNTAYVGPPSTGLMQFRSTYDHHFLEEVDQFKIKGNDKLAAQRSSIASFFGAQPNHTFITPNFSVGIRFFLEYLPQKTRFLILEADYPSLENAVRAGNFPTTVLPITASLEENIEQAIDHGTIDVLALSVVQYTSGVLIDQSFLSKLKKRYPNLLIIADGTQFLGTSLFHFDNAPFDLVVGSGYKWLLAGFGNGLAFVKPSYLDYCETPLNTLENRIYTGHFDFLAAASLTFAIKQLQDWDFPALLRKKNEVTDYLKSGLLERELLQSFVVNRNQHSSIFNMAATSDFHLKLLDKGVRCSFRGTGVRLSVHFYNTTEDIDNFFTIYDQLI